MHLSLINISTMMCEVRFIWRVWVLRGEHARKSAVRVLIWYNVAYTGLEPTLKYQINTSTKTFEVCLIWRVWVLIDAHARKSAERVLIWYNSACIVHTLEPPLINRISISTTMCDVCLIWRVWVLLGAHARKSAERVSVRSTEPEPSRQQSKAMLSLLMSRFVTVLESLWSFVTF